MTRLLSWVSDTQLIALAIAAIALGNIAVCFYIGRIVKRVEELERKWR